MTDYDTKRFLAQNSIFAEGLNEADVTAIDGHAGDHSGGLVVILRELSEDSHWCVKAHDTWGPGKDDGEAGDIVVHIYNADEVDDPQESVTYFDHGHDALQAFFAAERPGPDAPRWHKGDAVQTQIPYDDFPITVLREDTTWRAVHGKGDESEDFTDATINRWLEQGAADVKIRQDHQWHWTRGTHKPYGPCLLDCGADMGPEPEPERADPDYDLVSSLGFDGSLRGLDGRPAGQPITWEDVERRQAAMAKPYLTLGLLRALTAHLSDDMPITVDSQGLPPTINNPSWFNVELLPEIVAQLAEEDAAPSLQLNLLDDFDMLQF